MAIRLDVDAFQSVVSKFVGKDKILRLIQYFCRFNKGVLQKGLLPLAATELEYISKKNWGLFLTLMNARRAFRLFNSVGTLLKLRDGIASKPWGKDLHPLYMAVQWMMALWPAIDHYRFLILIKWAEGSQAEVRNFSYRIFAFAQVLTMIAQLYRAYLQKDLDEKKRKQAKWNAIKAGLVSLTIGHVSQFPGLITNEIVCGGTGVASSLMDLYTIWPKVISVKGKEDNDDEASARLMGAGASVFLVTLASVSFIRAGGMK
ncbi:hypothetical protein AAMO2058_000261700 [Amorphochlora amoebiformis]